MASVNFLKLHGAGEVMAQLRHSLTDERIKHKHSNPDIRTQLTQQNRQWGGDYAVITAQYKDRILELDATTNTNKRDNRVTCFALETAVPDGLTEAQADAWCDMYVAYLQGRYGQNFLGAAEHKDEVHLYVDRDGSVKKSRIHIHAYVVPAVDGQLNGKIFSCREEMIRMNRDLEELTQEQFGVRYLTGETPGHDRVERLKAQSAYRMREQFEAEVSRLKKEIVELVDSCNQLIDEQSELDRGNVDLAYQMIDELEKGARQIVRIL